MMDVTEGTTMTPQRAAIQILAQNPLPTRAQWQAALAERRAKVVALRSQGMTIAAIGAQLDMTKPQVRGVLRTARQKANS